MLSLSSSAAGVVSNIRDQQGVPETYALRVFPRETPEGVQIQLGFTAEPADGDVVTETEGTKVCVAPSIAEDLTDVVIDTQDTPEGEGLVLRKAEAD